MESGVVIGIDGGASSLKWSVRDRQGRLHHGKALGANPQLLDWQTYTARMTGTILEALTQADASPEDIVALGMGLAGVDRPAEQQRLYRWALEQYPTLQGCWVGNDALPALRQGAGRLAGIILIAGTGSIYTGVTTDGRIVRAGGWGGAIGDEGSGSWIGLQAVGVASQMADGRRRRTALLDALLARMELSDPMEMIPWVYNKTADELKRSVGALAPCVLDLARQGDPAARRLLRLTLRHLETGILTIARRLDEMEGEARERTVVGAGGLFEQTADLADALTPRLARRQPALKLVRLTEPASLGSLHLGLETPLATCPD